MGLDFGQDAINKMVADADLNGDGCIDYEEFAGLWKDHVVEVQYRPLVQRMNRFRMLVAANNSNNGGMAMGSPVVGMEASEDGIMTASSANSSSQQQQQPPSFFATPGSPFQQPADQRDFDVSKITLDSALIGSQVGRRSAHQQSASLTQVTEAVSFCLESRPFTCRRLCA